MTEKLIALLLSAVVIGCPLFGLAGVCGIAGSCCPPFEPASHDGCACCGSKEGTCDEDPRPCRPGKAPADSPCQCLCGGAVVGKPGGEQCLASPQRLGGLAAPVPVSTGGDADHVSSLRPSRCSRATPGKTLRCLLMSFLC